ncbi:hydroxyacylglutathione hydrolase [Desulfosarcina sp. BuS5]|uniref:hydroxyacylglutathione hydrolase family protein n=1 Tax=Desulfosarcina sp. BuS5 TaxID=933262 RepID=UPI000486EEC3|nr:hydroxyacylglutathione hydrolase family protein [Desulfosarcina sp. BuS5]WDN90349.1 hydroxyacylglutathione hydrolase [Desulfosarcina sp. BuS5]
MKLKQFRYSEDNLGYLIYGEKFAAAIDGGAVEKILSFLKHHNIELKYVLNTHTHPDHTSGNRALLGSTAAEHLKISDLIKKGEFELEGNQIHVYHTPGHTHDSVVYYFKNILLSGDTLFTGKVGRCFTGDQEGFLRSIKLILPLPHDTRIYAGHDYVKEYLETAKSIEPDNIHIDGFLKKYDPKYVFSTLEDELKINPTLRFSDKKIISILHKRGLPHNTELDCWKSLLSITQNT